MTMTLSVIRGTTTVSSRRRRPPPTRPVRERLERKPLVGPPASTCSSVVLARVRRGAAVSVVDSIGRSLPCALAARFVAPEPRRPRRLRAPVEGAGAPSGRASSRWVSARGIARRDVIRIDVGDGRAGLPPAGRGRRGARAALARGPGAALGRGPVALCPGVASAFSSSSRDPGRSTASRWCPRGRHLRLRRVRGRRDGGAASERRWATRMRHPPDVGVSGDAGSAVVVARALGVEPVLGVGSDVEVESGRVVVSALGVVVRGARAGRGRGAGAAPSSLVAPAGSRSAAEGPSWVLVPPAALPPVLPPAPEPLLLRPRPPRLRRRLGAPVPVEVPAPSDDGAAAPSPLAEDPVVRDASSERCRSALVVAVLSAATGLSWFIR